MFGGAGLVGRRARIAAFCRSVPRVTCRRAPGELGLYVGGRAHRNGHDPETRRRWLGMLTHIAKRARLQPGMAGGQFQGKVRRLPAMGQCPATDPTNARG